MTIRDLLGDSSPKNYQAVHFDNRHREALQKGLDAYTGHIARVRPYQGGPGMEYATAVIEDLHVSHDTKYVTSPYAFWKEDPDPPQPYAFEMWLEDGKIYTPWLMPNQDWHTKLQTALDGLYPQAQFETFDRLFVDVDDDLYVAGGELTLHQPKFYPIRSIDGWDAFPEEHDPFNRLTNNLTTPGDERVVIQVTFLPADDGWKNGFWNEFPAEVLAEDHKQGRKQDSYIQPRVADPLEVDHQKAEALSSIEDSKGWFANIRYFAFSEDPQRAVTRASSVGNVFVTVYHNSQIHQKFVENPIPADRFQTHLEALGGRDWSYNRMAFTTGELAALAHVPNKTIEANHFDFTRQSVGGDAPAGRQRKSVTGDGDDGDFVVETPTTRIPATPDTPEGVTVQQAAKQERDQIAAEQGIDTDPIDVDPGGGTLSAGKQIAAHAQVWIDELTGWKPSTHVTTAAEQRVGDLGGPDESDSGKSVTDLLTDIRDNPEYDAFIDCLVEGEITPQQIKAKLLQGGYPEDQADQFLEALRADIESRTETRDTPGPDSDDSTPPTDESNQQPTAEGGESPDRDASGSDSDSGPTPLGGTTADGATVSPDGVIPDTDGGVRTATDADDVSDSPQDTETGLVPKDASEDAESNDPADSIFEDAGLVPMAEETELAPHDTRDWGFPLTVTDVETKEYWDPVSNKQREFEILIETEEEGALVGWDVKNELFEAHREVDGEPLYIGYDVTARGLEEVGIEQHTWNRHGVIYGSTGAGKSTITENIANQVFLAGYGAIIIDPKGDTVENLLRTIPPERLQDIVWVDPASEVHDRVVGINFLDPGPCDSEWQYYKKRASIIDDLIGVLKGGDYWGPKMAGITKNIARAMMDSRRNFNLVDMYNVLLTEEKRKEFVNIVSQEGLTEVAKYTRQISEMDNEEVDAVLRRIQDWVEDPISRSIVAHRKGTLNIGKAVEEGKIILCNLKIGNEDIQKVVATALLRRVWSTIRARKKMNADEFDHYFCFIDEFHQIANPEMKIDEMLAMARSGKMSIWLCSQNPGQIPEEIAEQMHSNAETFISFKLNNPEHAGDVARRFDHENIEESDIAQLPVYRAVTQISYMGEEGPEVSDPFLLRTFPPYIPQRDFKETVDVREASLDEYGVERLTDYLEKKEDFMDTLGDEEGLMYEFIQAIWQELLRQPHGERDYVRVKDVIEPFKRRTGIHIEDYPDAIAIPEEYVWVERSTTYDPDNHYTGDSDDRVYISDIDTKIAITPAGKQVVLELDSGGKVSTTEGHRQMLRSVLEWYANTGIEVSITPQAGAETANDASGLIPLPETARVSEASQLLKEFEEDYPRAYDLSNAKQISFEAEKGTLKKPARTIQNFLRAVNRDQTVTFIVPHGQDQGYDDPAHLAQKLENIFTDPPFAREERHIAPGDSPDEDGYRETPVTVLYNQPAPDYLELGKPTDDEEKYAVMEKGEESVWVDEGNGFVVLYDGHTEDAKQRGRIRYDEIRFGSTNEFDWCRWDSHNNEWVVYAGGAPRRYETLKALQKDWRLVPRPVLPQAMLDDIDPDDVTWKTIIAPPGTSLEDTDSDDDTTEDETTKTASETTATTSDDMDIDADSDDNQDSSDTEFSSISDSVMTDGGVDMPPEDPDDPEDQGAPRRDWTVLADSPKSRADFQHCVFASEIPAEFRDGDLRPVIPIEEWGDHPSFVDDVTRNPTGYENAPEWVVDALIEYFGSEKQAGLVSADDPFAPANPPTDDADASADEAEEVPDKTALPDATDVVFDVESPYSDPTPERKPDETGVWAGGKDPSKQSTWHRIWDRSDLELDQPLTAPYLQGAIQSALGVRQDEATELIEIAEDYHYLLVTTHDGEPHYGLPSPRRTPGRYLDDPLEYADPTAFQSIWANLGYDNDEGVRESFLVPAVTSYFDYVDRTYGQAIIGTAVHEDVIDERDGEFYLSEARFPPFWRQVWEEADVELDEAIPAGVFPHVIKTAHGIADNGTIDSKANRALDHGIIYEVNDGAGYRLNDPASPDGPERTPIAMDPITPAETTPVEPETLTDPAPDETTQSTDAGSSDTEATGEVANAGTGAVSMADVDIDDPAPAPDTDTEEGESDQSPSETESESEPASQGDGAKEEGEVVDDTEDDEMAATGPLGQQSREQRADDYLAPDEDGTPETITLPDPVQAAFSDAIEFFQDHLDARIELNEQLNERAAETGERLRHPVTPRDYFGQSNPEDPEIPDALSEYDPNAVTATHCRGWSEEVIESAGLGYAPADEHALVKYLHWKGHDRETMVQTGLFIDFVASNHDYQLDEIDWDEYEFPEPPTEEERPADWRDHDVTRHDFNLAVHFVGRYVFPYFNENNDPVYAISRSVNQDEGGVEEDIRGDQKYTKAVKRGTSIVDEPIYGLDSIIPGEPLIITEGIADAITCHDFGIPCISPVTRAFKKDHFRPLKTLLNHHEIPLVYIVQDADPATVANNPDANPWEDTYPRAENGTYLTDKDVELPSAVSDRTHPSEETPAEVASSIWGAWPAGPISQQLSIKGDGPGVEGAVSTGTYLERNLDDTEVYLIELPRFGPEKMDLDDYLQNGWMKYCPPIDWIIRNASPDQADRDGETVRWSWLEGLKDAGEIVADPRLMGPEKLEERGYSTATSDGGFEPGSAPATALFGLLPTVHPKEHGLYSAEEATEMDAPQDLRPGSSGGRNALYDLTLPEVVGKPWGYRGKNPLGDHGDSDDYFSMDPDKGVKDFKYGVSYSPLSYLLCRAGERRPSDPNGELSKREHFMAWLQARRDNLISEDAPVPRNGLFWVAFDEGLATSNDVEFVTRTTRDGTEYTHRELPADAYNAALEVIENKYGEPPGRRPISMGDSGENNEGELYPGADESGESSSGMSTVTKEDFLDEEAKDLDNPLAYFLEEYIEIDPDHDVSDSSEVLESSDYEVPKQTFRRIYINWCKLHGHDPIAKSWMGRKLNEELPFNYGESRPVVDGERVRAYLGFAPNSRGKALLSFLKHRS